VAVVKTVCNAHDGPEPQRRLLVFKLSEKRVAISPGIVFPVKQNRRGDGFALLAGKTGNAFF
jgi:hypothetical protein